MLKPSFGRNLIKKNDSTKFEKLSSTVTDSCLQLIIQFRVLLVKVKLKAVCWMIKHPKRLFVRTISQTQKIKLMRKCTLEIWIIFSKNHILERHLQFQKVIDEQQLLTNFNQVLPYPACNSIIHIKSILVLQLTFLASVVKMKVYILLMREQKVLMMNTTLLIRIVIVAIAHLAPMSTIN